MNNNENTTFENVWDATKTVVKGKIIALSDYIRKKKRCLKSDI